MLTNVRSQLLNPKFSGEYWHIENINFIFYVQTHFLISNILSEKNCNTFCTTNYKWISKILKHIR